MFVYFFVLLKKIRFIEIIFKYCKQPLKYVLIVGEHNSSKMLEKLNIKIIFT